ncbi:5'-methylthioadenosine/adenosylhomocysteine nucleosidase [Alicyclobacillus mengziensis]|uniref:adenosylhomocysteine nucleosidase n=1 Tax=Alicyclobacillus mengziensis TaxID=2931921 RepID=A0A9X7Z533_9BACL|nr:5'-methylthioadenosine/adenosylhomocysteine nucleosidase [Alicyclobacillus mengziensis]QSO45947.1 5'-methylthioadenosine/adenosylhomocysteine nucleosidase [Alicyclobacillus mengziensis]
MSSGRGNDSSWGQRCFMSDAKQMMTQPVGILAAMDEELVILVSQLLRASESQHGGVRFLTGEIEGHAVVLGQCGIGKVNAAMATTLMHMLFKPKAILNTGTAGGLRDDFEVGDIVLGQNVCYHDADATVFGYAYGQVPQEPARYAADEVLLTAAARAGQSLDSVRVHRGLIASGDMFLGDEQARDLVRTRFPGVFAAEMEGAAIAQVAAHLQVPCLIVRAVSDLAGEDAKMTHEEFLRVAADKSAQLVVATLNEYDKLL